MKKSWVSVLGIATFLWIACTVIVYALETLISWGPYSQFLNNVNLTMKTTFYIASITGAIYAEWGSLLFVEVIVDIFSASTALQLAEWFLPEIRGLPLPEILPQGMIALIVFAITTRLLDIRRPRQ